MSNRGRPVKYSKKTFEDQVEKYLNERKFGTDKGPMTLLDFCCFAGIYKDYISEHDIGDDSKNDFSETIKMLKTECENSIQYWALRGKLNPAVAIFSLKNYGWQDTVTHQDPDGQPVRGVTVQIIKDKPDVD